MNPRAGEFYCIKLKLKQFPTNVVANTLKVYQPRIDILSKYGLQNIIPNCLMPMFRPPGLDKQRQRHFGTVCPIISTPELSRQANTHNSNCLNIYFFLRKVLHDAPRGANPQAEDLVEQDEDLGWILQVLLDLGSLLWAALQVHTRSGEVIPRQPENPGRNRLRLPTCGWSPDFSPGASLCTSLTPERRRKTGPLKQDSFLAWISNLKARSGKRSPLGHKFSTRIC